MELFIYLLVALGALVLIFKLLPFLFTIACIVLAAFAIYLLYIRYRLKKDIQHIQGTTRMDENPYDTPYTYRNPREDEIIDVEYSQTEIQGDES